MANNGIIFACATCGYRGNKLSLLKAHLETKKHRKNFQIPVEERAENNDGIMIREHVEGRLDKFEARTAALQHHGIGRIVREMPTRNTAEYNFLCLALEWNTGCGHRCSLREKRSNMGSKEEVLLRLPPQPNVRGR
jgi:hypothetical protein